jgi:hypothetical protein
MKKLTVLEVLADKTTISVNSAKNYPAESQTRHYREGEAAAYNDSYRLMKAELERLRNLWQNGALNYDSFGLPS